MPSYNDLEDARWVVPRPKWVKESEPTGFAWVTPERPHFDPADLNLNRQLFQEGRNRKPATGTPPASAPAARKTG